MSLGTGITERRNLKKAGYPRAISDGLTVVINAVLAINNKTITNIWSAVLQDPLYRR